MKRLMAVCVLGAALTALGTDYYVDATHGNDAWDGTAAAIPTSGTTGPKKTLAAAMGIAGLTGGDTVFAAAGTYGDGEMSGYRVRIPEGVKLVATGAKGETVIEGKYAPDVVSDATPWGCGTGALRCVYVGKDAHLVGFTVRGGRAEGIADDAASTVGGIGGAADGSIVVACSILDCKAGVSGGASGVTLIRCYCEGNASINANGLGVDLTGGKAWNCWFHDDLAAARASGTYSSGVYICISASLYNCRGSTGVKSCNLYNTHYSSEIRECNLYRCVYYKADYSGTVQYDECVKKAASAMVYDDDSRPVIGSNYGYQRGNAEYYYRDATEAERAYLDKDFAGGPRLYHGELDIGPGEADRGYLATDAAGMVGAAANRLTILSEPGFGKLNADDKTKFEIPGAGELVWTWPVDFAKVVLNYEVTGSMFGAGSLSFYLDDATVPFGTVTAADGEKSFAYSCATTHVVRAVLTGAGTGLVSLSKWTNVAYVRPDGVNATTEGWSADHPYRTLAYVTDRLGGYKPLMPSVIYALPGVYNEGTYGSNPPHRVRLGSNMTLISTEGRDVTVIEGVADFEGNETGCGANAVDGIYINTNSVLSGFTVRNACSRGSGFGGVCGQSMADGFTPALVYDCVISNCYGGTGGGLNLALAVNCQIAHNGCTVQGGNVSGSKCYNCCIFGDKTTATNNQGYNCYNSTLVGCTVFDGDHPDQLTGAYKCTIYNSYVEKVRGECSLYSSAYDNRDASSTADNPTFKLLKTDFELDENFRPVKKRCRLVNTGKNEYIARGLPAQYAPLADKDFAMGPRVLMDIVDIGCGEFDYVPAGLMLLLR